LISDNIRWISIVPGPSVMGKSQIESQVQITNHLQK